MKTASAMRKMRNRPELSKFAMFNTQLKGYLLKFRDKDIFKWQAFQICDDAQMIIKGKTEIKVYKNPELVNIIYHYNSK